MLAETFLKIYVLFILYYLFPLLLNFWANPRYLTVSLYPKEFNFFNDLNTRRLLVMAILVLNNSIILTVK